MFQLSKVKGSTIQKIATAVGNLLCVNYGLMFGITSSHLLLYQSTETPLNRPIDNNQASWITGWLCLGAVGGSLIFGFTSDKIGPKLALMLSGLMQIAAWFCILFGYDILHIYASRIFAGFATGGIFTVLPLYITEISKEANRGSLTATIAQMRNFGIICGFVVGSFVPYKYISWIGIALSLLFNMIFPFVQDSPYHYLRTGNTGMMEKSLRWFRGIRSLDDRQDPEFLQEMDKFHKLLSDAKSDSEQRTPLPTAYLTRVILISTVMVMVTQFCGVFALLNYAETIFKDLKTELPSYWSAIILSVLQFCGTFMSALLADKINRKILICVTSLVCGVSLIVLALFMSNQEFWAIDLVYVQWVPLVLLSVHVIFANIGLFPLSFVVIAEIAPKKIKGFISSIAMSFCYVLAFVTIKYYYLLVGTIGLAGCLWIFAVVCIFDLFFTWFFVPETRGKSFEQIQQLLGGVSKSNPVLPIKIGMQ